MIAVKYVRKGAQIVIDKGLGDDRDLFNRLVAELKTQKFLPVATRGRNRALLPKLTLVFSSVGSAERAEKWIDDHFEA